MINAGIIGHTGRLGKPLVALLRKHPEVRIQYTESRSEGSTGDLGGVDVVFLALPEGESEQHLSKLRGKRIIDLSVDHRNHSGWVYGLPELGREPIRNAIRVANPGCYATSIILGLAPIRELIHDVRISSTSGISGAGLTKQTADNFSTYKEGREHSHVPEIEQALGLEGIEFVPQRIDTADRGIVSTIFAKYNGLRDASESYKKWYGQQPFVRLVDKIETRNVNGTNFCDVKIIPQGKSSMIVVTALDNLLKGGAGQAVQNFNIMYGFDEKTALVG